MRFNYDAELVNLVKTIPGRRWDQKNRQWSVPLDALADLIRTFSPHQFSYSSELRTYLEENSSEEKTAPIDPTGEEEELALSVSQLNFQAQELLREGFSTVILLDGEVSGLARNKKVGHAYFELIDRKNGVVAAKINAICFAKIRSRISGRLARVGKRIQDGEKYRFIVKPELYTKQGQFQVVIQDIEMEAIFRAVKGQRDEVIAQLKKENILEINLKKKMPICPVNIGLISALDSDAYNDFIHELERSPYQFQVHFLNAKMQGVDAAQSVSAALKAFQKKELDGIAIVRGGGAKSTLADLDALELGRAVCTSKMKVICGIGHHRDRGVLDAVCLSEKTPTAAAQFLVKRVDAFSQKLLDVENRIIESAVRELEIEEAYMETLGQSLEKKVLENTRATEMKLEALASTIPQSARHYLRGWAEKTGGIAEDLDYLWRAQVSRKSRRTDRQSRRFQMLPLGRKLDLAEKHLERMAANVRRGSDGRTRRSEQLLGHLEKQLQWMKPDQTLKRGYALLRKEGKIIKGIEDLNPGDRVEATLYDGKMQLTLIKIEKELRVGKAKTEEDTHGKN